MIFENGSQTIPIRFLACWKFNQGKVNQFMEKRKFCTIAIRLRSDANIEWDKGRLDIGDNAVVFTPQNLAYTRRCDYDEFIAVNFETYNYVFDKIVAFTPKNYDLFLNLFNQILHCYNSKESGSKYKCTALLCEIISLFQTEYEEDSLPMPKLIAEAYDYIHTHYNESDCTVEKLAQISHVSEEYFRKLFKQVVKISPKRYIGILRIEYGARLLAQTHLSVGQIAEQAGFNDSKHFATVFKSVYRATPSQFRKQDVLFNIVDFL